MTKPLVIVAHPNLAASRINAAWIEALTRSDIADVHDLYKAYPDGKIDVAAEQQRVERHDRIIFQFPLFWYSCPPFLSTWLVDVYRRGWAYGPGGRALNGKTFGIAISTGSNGRDYTEVGRYHRTLEQLTIPFELLAVHACMHYLPPFSITGVREVSDADLERNAVDYCRHVASAEPVIVWDGKDDSRAKTVYPAHYYSAASKEQSSV